MTMDREKATALLRELFPAFDTEINRLCEEWAPELPPFTLLMASVGHQISNEVDMYIKPSNAERLSMGIERMLRDGSDDVRNAVATGLLESLMANAAHKPMAEHLFSQLGPLAKEYCRAWDTFTGVRTPGIY
jgi:hypothetical protein